MKSKLLFGAACATLFAVTALPLSANELNDAEKAIKARLSGIIPGASSVVVDMSPIKGLYQVNLGGKLIYMSADGKFLVDGEIIDLVTRSNVTQQANNDLRKRTLSTIDASSTIRYPAKGDTQHVATIFTDIDCPYCRKLHHEIPKLNEAGIEVRYLAYPRAGIGSPSHQKMVNVFCADNPAQAMTDAKNGKDLADNKCENPIEAHMDLVQAFGVNGTPNIILDSGEMIPGYVPAEELIKSLNK